MKSDWSVHLAHSLAQQKTATNTKIIERSEKKIKVAQIIVSKRKRIQIVSHAGTRFLSIKSFYLQHFFWWRNETPGPVVGIFSILRNRMGLT
jgi:hypothetical protein